MFVDQPRQEPLAKQPHQRIHVPCHKRVERPVIREGTIRHFDLLKELGKVRRPVLLKRGMSATIEEWLLSADRCPSWGRTPRRPPR